jgi:hypothetical protein
LIIVEVSIHLNGLNTFLLYALEVNISLLDEKKEGFRNKWVHESNFILVLVRVDFIIH